MILYKYRNFGTADYWRRIFTHQEFWFSIPENLDDEEEVSIEWVPPHYREEQFETQIRGGCSILSLGRTSNNDDLWRRYGGDGSTHDLSGFCVEADFQAFESRGDLFFTEVQYINQPANVVIDRELIIRFQQNEQQVVDEVWQRLYFQKNTNPWSIQNEYRFLYHSNGVSPGYRGMALSLPREDIRKVFFFEERISDHNLQELRAAVADCGPHVILEPLRSRP